MGLAEKIRENHELAAATQQALRNGRRVIRRIAEVEPISLPAVIETQPLPQPVPIPHTAISVSPLDLPAEQFKAGLNRRKANRELLMEWLRSALVDGVDFGRIHVASKERCQFAKQGRSEGCDPHHWSKPSLFKPGAEKITGMLGMTVHYPSLPDYEQAVLNGTALTTVMLRCELRDAHGRVIAEGVGARNVSQDYGDMNKTLKMAEKSAHIDATLRCAGLSECYSQDLEDRPVEGEVPDAPLQPKPRRSAKSATPASGATAATTATDSNTDDSQIEKEQLTALRQHIRQYGFTENEFWHGSTKRLGVASPSSEQLTPAQCSSILKRLAIWSEGEKTFANGQSQPEGGSHE
ncbi:MAG: hypothetical protein IPQ01_03950 [Zoogloea sp.]|nr:hypothetical protein [Zoogloea sp.]